MVTLIHEASHKYAGTIDYSYFTNDSQRAISTFDDKAKALMNADSYAFFVLKIGRGSFLKDVFGGQTWNNNMFSR